jgi:cell fate regulator YaaT (PSP1 superfamily)
MTYQIRVLSTGQVYKIETEEPLRVSEDCLVEAEQIIEPAVVLCLKCPKKDIESLPLANFLRVMKELDLAARKKLKEKAGSFVEEAQTKAMRHGLNMKIVDADLSFDEKKITLYFTAEGRIDFRSLVSDMVGSFRKIIRLQQIGPRDETKLMGGYGRCGQELCCHRFIKDLDGVSAQMATLQEIGGGKLNKMTGCCGRLMCCLSYETDDIKNMPKMADSIPSSSEGKPNEEVK